MKKIILDTNFLMIPLQFKVDIFTEIDRIMDEKYEICIVENTLKELKDIFEKQSGKDKAAAKFALQLIQKKKPRILAMNKGDVDSSIVALAKEEGYIIATQDVQLKRRLSEFHRQIIVLRQKSHLEMLS